MSVEIKPAGKIAIILLVVGAIFGGAYFSGALRKLYGGSSKVENVELPTARIHKGNSTVKFSGLPSDEVSTKQLKYSEQAIFEHPEWNALLGAQFANGGPLTTTGSLAEANGVRFVLRRQDDDSEKGSTGSIIKTAQDMHDGKDISNDVIGFFDMGDGGPTLLATLNAKLKKIDPSYRAVVVAAVGKSGNDVSGEDGFWGPSAWKENPALARGGLIAAAKLNGDWNIMVQWCHDNNKYVSFNTDESTFCKTSLNFINADTYQQAGDIFIAGKPEKRALVDSNGRSLGRDTSVSPQGYCSWTPVDVTVSKAKGGVQKLASTKEYSNQMFCVLITINKYVAEHHDYMTNVVKSMLQGGDQVQTYSAALNRAGEIAAKIYKDTPDKDGPYWVKYSKGVVTVDEQNIPITLGGSTQFNLADDLFGFGLTPGSTNIYATVYTNFRNQVDLKLYPKLYIGTPIPEAEDAIDLSVLRDLQQTAGDSVASAVKQDYSAGNIATKTNTTANGTYAINFTPGSSTLTPDGIATVEQLHGALTNAGSQKVNFIGYTDNTGNAGSNIGLSKQRAEAVKNYLEGKYPSNYKPGRLHADGKGNANPIGDNSTADGRAKNRRVEVIIYGD